MPHEYDYVKNYSLPPNRNARDHIIATAYNPAYGMPSGTRSGIATTKNPAYEMRSVSEPTQASDYLSPVGKNPGGEPSDYLSPVGKNPGCEPSDYLSPVGKNPGSELSDYLSPVGTQSNTSGVYEDIPQ